MSQAATILIVDHEERDRRLLELMLQPEGYVTITAADGREALAAVADHSIDLILLAITMPGMDGCEVASTLKANSLTKSIPIIMVTAAIDRDTRLTALAAGVEEFLAKPIDRAELWLRVRNLLRLKEYGDFLEGYSTVLEQRVAERTAELQRFRMAMDSTVDAIFLTSRTTMRFVEVNATASALLGYTRDELLGLAPAELLSTDVEHLVSIFDAVIGGDTTDTLLKTRVRRKDGSDLPVELHRYARRSGEDWIIVDVFHDITEREVAEERLLHLAQHDALTGLPNRTLFYETLKTTLSFAARKNSQVAIMFLDVDHFKDINDTLGHVIGDKVLVQIAERLLGCVRLRDTVGRLGGDEFAFILPVENELGAGVVADKVRQVLREPLHLDGNDVNVTASIGITMYPTDATRPEILLKYADTAMYGAKQAGRDIFCFFKPQMNSDVRARLEVEQSLRKAIDNEEFVLHYQPKVELITGRVVGVEALLRWERPGHGLVQPNQFIPVLEATGLIREVGNWVIVQACKQMAAWVANGIGSRHVAVNVSARQFLAADLDDQIGAALLAHGVPADALELELTESSLIADTQLTIATLQKLKARGVQVSIDDFGTGYSCLAYLRQFPIDKLKIDIAFIRNITTNLADAAMTEAIIRIAHSLEMDVIAEGVETAGQLSHLLRHGCDQIQGYYFSRPLPLAALEELLRRGTTLSLPDDITDVPRTTVLLVDDDAKALTSLEHLFEHDGYHIVTAASASAALEMLALHQVHVIVSSGAVAPASEASFLELARDLYPDSPRIVLSGPTDSHLVIDTVNRCAVYGFYAKPWDGEVLRDKVREACRHYRRLHDGPVVSPLAIVTARAPLSVARV